MKLSGSDETGMSEWKTGEAVYFADRRMIALLVDFTNKPISIVVTK
jgi:hypothetical protein